MAFTTPITWTTNQLVSAANLNEQVRDNMNAVWLAAAVRVYHNAAQSLTTAALTTLAFNSERFDQAAGVASTQHDVITNSSRLTCRVTGVYQISACIQFAANATGIRQLNIQLGGTTVIAAEIVPAAGTGPTIVSVSTLYSLTATTDYVEVIASQTSGGNLNVDTSANYSPEFMMVRVG